MFEQNQRPENAEYISYAKWYKENEARKKCERKRIRYLGFMTGAAILSMILLENVATLLILHLGFYDLFLNNPDFQTGIDIIIRVFSTLVPFAFFARYTKRKTGIKTVAPLEKPIDTKLAVLGIIAGIGFCMIANIVSSYLTVFIEAFGFKLSLPEDVGLEGMSSYFLTVIRVAVLAPILEELALRGCTMQPLRKFGDGFAIVMSAFAFGLMHGNLIQAPFALIVGFALGYITVKTGSLWPAIIIHAINNFISVSATYLSNMNISEQVLGLIYSFIIYSLMLVGIIAYAFFQKRAKKVSPKVEDNTSLSFLQKTFAFIMNPTMIVAIIFMLYITSTFVERA